MSSEHRIMATLDEAYSLVTVYRSSLLEMYSPLVDRARRAVAQSQEASRYCGVDAICRRCDREEGGSCCGAGIELRYTIPLLVANLLVGVSFPLRRYDERSCYFLVPSGCSLTFRHTLCVNFLCKTIYDALGVEQVVALQHAYGEEVTLTFLLCDAISRHLTEVLRDGPCGLRTSGL